MITARPDALPIDGLPEAVVHDTGDTPTIASLVAWANEAGLGRAVTAADTLKNVLLKVRQPGGEWELLAIGLPGDREVDDKRLGAALEPAEYALLDDADFAKYPFLVKGYIGPKALRDNDVRYLVDPRVVDGTSWITGADEPGRHVVGLVAGRDFTADGTIEAAEVREGDPSPDGAGPLVMARGIEIGHIFQLGRKYTDAFTVDVLGEDGKPVRLTMGSYGLGVSRLVAVVAEQQHDELGLRWPSAIAPFDVHLVIANKDARGPRPEPRRWPPTWIGWASRCCSTTARHRPASSSKTPSCWACPGSSWLAVAGRTAWWSCATASADRLASWPPGRRWPPTSWRPWREQPASRTRRYSLPPGKLVVMGQAPSTRFHRAAITALWVRAVEANARSSAGLGVFDDRAPSRRAVVLHPHGQARRIRRRCPPAWATGSRRRRPGR